jgi:tetratricopeptide (TPR) repeat protein
MTVHQQLWMLALCGFCTAGAAELCAQSRGAADVQEAKRLRSEGRLEQAAERFLLAASKEEDVRDAAWATLRAGECWEEAGRFDPALAAFNSVLASTVRGEVIANALFRQARVCSQVGCTDHARAAIERLQAEFPDSTCTAQAAVVKATLAGQSPKAAEELVAQEEESTQVFKEAMGASRGRREDEALHLLDTAIRLHPGVPAALRASEYRAHLLIRMKRTRESAAAFEAILGRCTEKSPQSRLVQTCRVRLAALKQVQGDHAGARDLYKAAAQTEGDLKTEAALQWAGVEFELLQRRDLGSLRAVDWEAVRLLCRQVLDMPDADTAQKARAGTMLVETFSWQNLPEQAVDAAKAFLATFQDKALRREIATVHFCAGEALVQLKQHREALEHYRWIMGAYPDGEAIWAGMEHMPRVYYRTWEALRAIDAPPAESHAVGATLLSRYPESRYARRIELLRRVESSRETK